MSNQTYELRNWLRDHLRAKKFPFPVLYAPERTDRTKYDPVILVMRDRETSERVGSAEGTQKNGRKFRTRRVPVKIKLFMKSSLDGARLEDHEEITDYAVDALIVALETWSTAQRGGGIEYGEMSFLTPEENVTADGKPEGWPGVVYVMRFTIGRGVVERDYLKAVKPTGTITSAGSVVEVRQTDSDGDPVDPAAIPIGTQPEEDP